MWLSRQELYFSKYHLQQLDNTLEQHTPVTVARTLKRFVCQLFQNVIPNREKKINIIHTEYVISANNVICSEFCI